jgi:hypothetical protein
MSAAVCEVFETEPAPEQSVHIEFAAELNNTTGSGSAAAARWW